MDALLRELQPSADGIAEYQDTDFSGDALTIGSAANSTIQLLGVQVSPEHAIIRRAGNTLDISGVKGARFAINGAQKNSAKLQPGDLIELGGHKLRIARAPSGFDFAIEIEPNPNVDSSAYESAFRTEIEQALPSKRVAAWGLLALILVVSFLLPLAGVFSRHHGVKAPHWLPADTFWSTGPLIPAHQQAAGERCDHCHRSLFIHVRDADCRDCHATTIDHARPERLAKIALGAPERCASCHREHNDSPADFVVRADQTCTTCHARGDAFASLQIAATRAFETGQHPDFKPELLLPVVAAAGNDVVVRWRRQPVERGTAHEQSNLKFSHAQHLDAAKVASLSSGAGLGCGDCHRLNADGEHFEPITMQTSCAGCHELTFDAASPERQLPHGKPREVVLTLQEYFARKYSDPAAAPVVRERRRLPGRDLEEIQCTGGALDCARRTAAEEIEIQFKRRGCVSCHTVVDTQAADLRERFQVNPVRLSTDYYPHAHFDHAAHRIQKEKRGDAACVSCHAATRSEQTTDLLIPGIDNCLECHRSAPHADQVAAPCVSCHAYHPRPTPTQAPETDAATARSEEPQQGIADKQ